MIALKASLLQELNLPTRIYSAIQDWKNFQGGN